MPTEQTIPDCTLCEEGVYSGNAELTFHFTQRQKKAGGTEKRDNVMQRRQENGMRTQKQCCSIKLKAHRPLSSDQDFKMLTDESVD